MHENTTKKFYLRMIQRDYCVTVTEQKDIARKYGVPVDRVLEIVSGIDVSMLKTANKVKKSIDEAMLKAEMSQESGRLSK